VARINALLSLTFAAGSTLLGEKEPGSWYEFMGFHPAITNIPVVGVWDLL